MPTSIPPRPRPTLGGPAWLLLVGFLFHATYLASIFDIYFVSPVVRVGPRFSPLDPVPGEPSSARAGVKPLASRVVLIIGDGLRADKLYSTFPDPPFDPPLPVPVLPGLKPIPTPFGNQTAPGRMTPAPYMRSLIEAGQASWGVSHTRVPTESRPGHVAIIAGMYEDVSAVTRGWKMNPVNFDSLFNQSSHSFTFGSPDILPMFKHGASDPSRVDAWSYDSEAEDFTKDAAQLDIWVYDRLKSLLSEAARAGPGSTLDAQLRSDQVFFFLHLLGLDTTGHSYRPHSPEYLRNVQVVDQVVQGAQQLLDDFYADNRTAYIFTADHGMSNIGNHGDGDPDNTRTPIVAWGSGLQKASDSGNIALDKSSQSDPYYQNWNLNMSLRKDVEQADLAGLMAALAGIRVPSNSVGRLPLEYLDAPSSELARATYANTREILQQYETKHDLKASRTYWFQPFGDLPTKETLSKPTILERLFYIQRLILSGRDAEAIKACQELQELALKGLRYLQRYDWLRLRVIVVCGYVGWMIYCALFVIRTYTLPSLSTSSRKTESDIKFGSIIGTVTFLALSMWFYLERSPFTYYLYALFPAYFWAHIIDELDSFQDVLEWTSRGRVGGTSAWTTVLVSLVSLECMVAGYFYRVAWTVGWVVIGMVWPMLGMSGEFRKTNRALVNAWRCAALGSGVFTVLPVEKGESLLVIALGGVGFLLTGWLARRMGYSKPSRTQLGVVGVTLLVTLHSASQLQQKKGLPVANQVVGWLILLGSSAAPLLCRSSHPSHGGLTSRLVEIIFAYAPVFVILSISYEALFYLAFSVALLIWLEVETRLAQFGNTSKRRLASRARFELVDIRLCLFFLFFIHVGFFGTGNVGSISSFYLEPVYRLVPIFNPILMSILLLFKILIPFLIVSSVFKTLTFQLGLPKYSLFIGSLMISDVLTLNFFFFVIDIGSWLEIGQSISHFAIDSLLLVFMIVLDFLGQVFIDNEYLVGDHSSREVVVGLESQVGCDGSSYKLD